MELKAKNINSRSIPRWAYILFAVLVVLFSWRAYLQQKNAAECRAASTATRLPLRR